MSDTIAIDPSVNTRSIVSIHRSVLYILASHFLHKVPLEPANQHENWQSVGISFFLIMNKVEVERFFVLSKIRQVYLNAVRRDQKIKFFSFFFDKKKDIIFYRLIEGSVPIVLLNMFIAF